TLATLFNKKLKRLKKGNCGGGNKQPSNVFIKNHVDRFCSNNNEQGEHKTHQQRHQNKCAESLSLSVAISSKSEQSRACRRHSKLEEETRDDDDIQAKRKSAEFYWFQPATQNDAGKEI